MHPPFKLISLALAFVFLVALAPTHSAQSVYSEVMYKFDLAGATEAPELGGMPSIKFPDEAVRKGVEGKLVVEMKLAADGQVKDYKFIETLPHGYEQAIIDAFSAFNFVPARKGAERIDVMLRLEYTVSMIYDSRDKSVKKPKITRMPEPAYPASERAGEHKGEVTVKMLFRKDGTHKVLGVSSTMPKEFDKAAAEASKDIEFTPGTHKKTKKQVSVTMNVVYKFKP